MINAGSDSDYMLQTASLAQDGDLGLPNRTCRPRLDAGTLSWANVYLARTPRRQPRSF